MNQKGQSEQQAANLSQSHTQPQTQERSSSGSTSGSTASETAQTAVQTPPQATQATQSTAASPQLPRQKLGKWLFRSFAFGLSATISAVVGAGLVLMTPLPPAIAPEGGPKPFSLGDLWRQGFRYTITRPINILVMGIDLPLNLPEGKSSNVFAGRSDTMLLVHLDPNRQTISVLSIPRDTQVEIPELGLEKINYANAVGGPTLSAQVVSRTLNGITIDRYVRVSTGAFRELVDLVGGIEVDVPQRMEYTDNTQKLKIDLYPGQQTLDGGQAEQFARFRNDANGDIGRVQRQQQVIRALREKLSNPTLVTKLPQAIELFQRYIDTNLTMEEMLAMADLGLDLGQENFQMVMLPGRFSTPSESVASYWILDPAAKDQVLQEHFDVSSVAAVAQQHDSKEIRVAVQNASSDAQLGSQVATYLQAQGFSNVYVIEDAPAPQDQTQIIAQNGDVKSAEIMGTVLGVGKVVPASTGDIQSDLTIRVGGDWTEQPRLQSSY